MPLHFDDVIFDDILGFTSGGRWFNLVGIVWHILEFPENFYAILIFILSRLVVESVRAVDGGFLVEVVAIGSTFVKFFYPWKAISISA